MPANSKIIVSLDGQEFELEPGQAREVYASIGGQLARGLSGRPISNAPRCACGAMTLRRAQARGHRCEPVVVRGERG